MRVLDERARLDDAGQLWTLQAPPYDMFAPLNAERADVLVPSGAFFDSVPTFGAFFSNWWENNPLQFATEDTAAAVLGKVRQILGPTFRAIPYNESVNVGPFQWATKRKIMVQPISDEPSGEWVNLCAGLEAAAFARNPANYAIELRDRVK